jgi:transposase
MASDVSVTVGVDTHSDAHVGVALDHVGRRLGEVAVSNDENGYRRLLRWASGFGELACVGVEGTGSYGAGLSRFLRSGRVRVIEVERLSRQHRRRHGKHDAADAEAAARAVLSGEATGEPKAADGCVEMLRALKVARRSAVKAKTQAANQLHALVMTAPERLRADLSRAPRTEAGREGFALPVQSGAGRPDCGNEVRPALRGSSLPAALRRDLRARRTDRTPREGSLSRSRGARRGGTRHGGDAHDRCRR